MAKGTACRYRASAAAGASAGASEGATDVTFAAAAAGEKRGEFAGGVLAIGVAFFCPKYFRLTGLRNPFRTAVPF